MIQDIEKIKYRFGVVNEELEIAKLPVRTLSPNEISPKLYKELWETNVLNFGGKYGNKGNPTKPSQCDDIRIHLTDDMAEITVFNRAKLLRDAGDSRIARIARFFCALQEFVKPKREVVR